MVAEGVAVHGTVPSGDKDVAMLPNQLGYDNGEYDASPAPRGKHASLSNSGF
jgi:hypothetical protein